MNTHQREYSSAIRAGIKHMNATWDSIEVSKVNDLRPFAIQTVQIDGR